MCGICGKIDPKGIDREEIERMVSCMEHRGPDGQGIYISNRVGLGHRRLSIIDIEGGKQPMSNEDGSLWIIFNGEIYNFNDLKKELENRHVFKTKSDTEVILHLYEEKAENCVKYLRGMFAFAIYDKPNQKLFISRDHLGQKPLYYYHDRDTFAFASEIKSLLTMKNNLREIDCKALYEYLTARIITSPRSMFHKIKKLHPGHFLVFHRGNIAINRYWQLRYGPKLTGNFSDILEELEKQVATTVKYHLVSDVPVGAFLSGGIDSSLIVAMMNRVNGKTIKTFSGDVPYEKYSELPYAKLMSDKYGTANHELTIRPSLVRKLPDLIWHLDEPSDPLSVCMYCLSELSRKEVKVVLGGDGGDELFGGYDRYYGNILASYYALIPEAIRKTIFNTMIKLFPERFWYRSFSHQIKWIHQISSSDNGDRYAKSLSYFYFSDGYKKDLYTSKFRKSIGMFDPEACLKDFFDSDNANETIDKMLFVDSMTRMPDHPNMILDRMSMAHGLEARSPFLDHKLAEFCASIPSRFKVRGKQRRYIQVKLAQKYLPPELIARKKQGFASPLTYLLADEFKLLYKVFLNNSRLVNNDYIRQTAIDKLLDEHLRKKNDHGNRLWLILNAEVWYRMYIENQSRSAIRERINRYNHPE